MNRIRAVWGHRTASEYRSATLAAETLTWTLRLGLSPETVRLAHRVVRDELDHAELCFAILQAAGGTAEVAPVPEAWLTLPHEPDRPLVARALAVAADEYAVAETVALQVFKHMARQVTAEPVVAAVRRIVEDEGHHSAFGWRAVEELLERTGDEGRAFVRERIPAYLRRVREAYRSEGAPCTPEELAWGLMDPAVYDSVVPRALEGVAERFDRLLGTP